MPNTAAGPLMLSTAPIFTGRLGLRKARCGPQRGRGRQIRASAPFLIARMLVSFTLPVSLRMRQRSPPLARTTSPLTASESGDRKKASAFATSSGPDVLPQRNATALQLDEFGD